MLNLNSIAGATKQRGSGRGQSRAGSRTKLEVCRPLSLGLEGPGSPIELCSGEGGAASRTFVSTFEGFDETLLLRCSRLLVSVSLQNNSPLRKAITGCNTTPSLSASSSFCCSPKFPSFLLIPPSLLLSSLLLPHPDCYFC